MKEPETASRREDKAVQALISAALHARSDEVSMEEIQPYLSDDIVLSAEDESALECSRKSPFGSAPLNATIGRPVGAANAAVYLALHRKQPETGFSAKTEAEIRRKREELLKKLRKKKGPA